VRARETVVLIVLAVAAVAAAGCGGVGYSSGPANTSNGETLFKARCGQCHALAAAGTQGTIGPNLDDAFRQGRTDGMTEETVRQVVLDQIHYPIEKTSTGAPGMPGIDETLPECGDQKTAGCVEDQDEAATNIAAYVASVAGVASARPGGAPAPGGGGTDGKAIFTSAGCVSCHTLADAGSSGTVGPNLDQAKPPEALVVDRVTNGRGAMPPFKGQLTAAQIQAVAKYVSSVAGE
jgi:cbb3-type cytochrome c oxidase subunit III